MTMKVKELIELLKKEDPEADVMKVSSETNDSGTSWDVEHDIYYVTTAKVERKKNPINQVLLH